MNILQIKPDIKITILGEEHDPSKEFELVAFKENDCYRDEGISELTQVVDSPYGLSAIIILKESKYWNDPENSYNLMHNCREIHYLHMEGHCAFEGWATGMNMHYFGECAKEMHIIKSPKWFSDKQEQVIYSPHKHPPINKEVHPTWTGYLPPYAAQPVTV